MSKDEDFRAESTDDGSPSEISEGEDGGAVTASDDSGDRHLMKKSKKKKVKEGADGDGAKKIKKKVAKGAEDDSNPRPKKKAKKQGDDD